MLMKIPRYLHLKVLSTYPKKFTGTKVYVQGNLKWKNVTFLIHSEIFLLKTEVFKIYFTTICKQVLQLLSISHIGTNVNVKGSLII